MNRLISSQIKIEPHICRVMNELYKILKKNKYIKQKNSLNVLGPVDMN